MKEYHKIATVFERDIKGTKKLIEGQFCNETVEFLADNKWLFTEKIDGTNIRVHWDGHKIDFAGRTDDSDIPNRLRTKLTELFMNDETEQLFEQVFGEKEVFFIGEGYGTKINKAGDKYRSDTGFILFDIMVGDMYLYRENVENIATTFGLEVVPVIMLGTIQEAVDYVKTKPDSTIGTAKMEGLVGHPLVEMLDRKGNRVIVKIKVKDFA